MQRSPFMDDVILTVGDWTWMLWREVRHDSPCIVSPPGSAMYAAGCWSPTRAGRRCLAPARSCIHCFPRLDISKSEGRRYVLVKFGFLGCQAWRVVHVLSMLTGGTTMNRSRYSWPGCEACNRPTSMHTGVVYMARTDGLLEVWDMVDRTHEPVASMSVCAVALTTLAFNPVSATVPGPHSRPAPQLLAAGLPTGSCIYCCTCTDTGTQIHSIIVHKLVVLDGYFKALSSCWSACALPLRFSVIQAASAIPSNSCAHVCCCSCGDTGTVAVLLTYVNSYTADL